MGNGFFSFLNTNENSTTNSKDKILKVKTNRCPQNHPCPAVKVCPVGALSQQRFDAPTVDLDKCVRCNKCSNYCPMRALVLE